MRKFALHGFLGLPSDWDFLPDVEAVDILAFHSPSEGLVPWAKAFSRYVASLSDGPHLLLGYSMGARLAMHVLLEKPELWVGAVFISGHPGLADDEQRKKRRFADAHWAARFLKEPWEVLLKDWNRQPIFETTAQIKRGECDYVRAQLAAALLHFSLGAQKDLKNDLLACQVPQLFIAGGIDQTYRSLAKEYPLSTVIPQVGHRLLWEAPEQLMQQIEEFIHADTEKSMALSQEV